MHVGERFGVGYDGVAEGFPAADLRFTEQETRQLVTTAGITLSDDAMAMLHRRTEGWAAGLRLAAISLAAHPDPERFVAEFSGSNHTVAEYLIAEMLERQPDHVRNLDGQVQTIRTLLRAFPQGVCAAHPDLAVVYATDDLAKGRLDEATARLAVARSHVATTPPEQRRRLGITIASLDLLLARKRGNCPPGELRVLGYLPTNLTRPAIAGALSVSLNTVNTHLRNIYAKLGARDRTTAVARARELGLVSSGRTR